MFDERQLTGRRDEAIAMHGAREHNLKNISLTVPRGQFVVVTGVSGSGKSTLAFDLLFAEGQRRFLDSMNAYARQFVEQLSRPDVDLIVGIPPAGRFQGVALVNNIGSYNAQVAEVSVERGKLRVHRVVCAVDCGRVVNPAIVRQQIESGIRSE